MKVWLFSVLLEEKHPEKFIYFVNPSTKVTEIYFKAIDHDTPFNSFVTVGLFIYLSNYHRPYLLQTYEDGRVGNVLCAYSSLMVRRINDYLMMK